MKKKLFGYLTLAFAIMSIGLVGSCRDYDEDVFRVKQELKDADNDLYDTIIKRYNWSLDSLRALRTDVNTKFEGVNNTLKKMDSTMQALHKRDSVINDSLQNLYKITSEADSILNHNVDSIAEVLKNLNDVVDSLVDLNHHEPYNDSLLAARVDSLAGLNHHDLYDDSLLLAHDSILFDSVKSYYNHFLKIDSTLTVIQDTLDSVMVLVDTLNNRVNRLMDQVNDLMNVEKKRITSLYVQGALNPTFGYFSLPGGIKNNILMGYYGEAAYDAEFPAVDGTSPTSALIYDTPSAYMLSATEAANIGSVASISLTAGDVIPANNDTVALGKIYLTVNPNEVEIDSTYTFKFVNSLGQESKATIGELTPSSDKLQFGFRTRGTSADSTNGFYEAPVTVLASDVESIAPEIGVSVDQLKAIVQKLRNKQLDLSGIAGAVFDLFQTKLDAQAVKTTWTDSLGTHNITSYYDVAATAVKPLSFSAMSGIGGSISIPTISPIGDLSSFVPSFTMPSLGTLSIGNVNITINQITLTDLGGINVTFSNPTIGSQTVDLNNLRTVLQNNLNDFTGATQDEINSKINALIDEIEAEVDSKLRKIEINMQTSVNNLLADLETNIGNSFNGYISKLNTIIGKFNSMASRLNSIISQGAGALLQPVLVYEGVDGNMHPVSNDAAHPSVATGAVGQNLILYPTTYSAELLAPAYKKYVAIVDVTDGGSMTTSTNSNCGSYFNQVIDGGRYGIDFKPEAAGTYVIYYSAIDYNGRIAANRFYIKVQ